VASLSGNPTNQELEAGRGREVSEVATTAPEAGIRSWFANFLLRAYPCPRLAKLETSPFLSLSLPWRPTGTRESDLAN
jgi:hypothetical protein